MGSTVDVLGSYWTLAGDADPNGGREWSTIDFDERVATAAAVGFVGIGLWHADLEHLLETWTLEELREVLDDHGIEHVELEFLDGWFLHEDEPGRREADQRRAFLLDVAERLDARHVKVGNFARLTRPVSRIAEGFADLCDDAADHGTRVGLEFLAAEGTVNDFGNAREVVRRADRANGGLLLDVWHAVREGVHHDEIRDLAADDLVSVELNDGLLDPPDRPRETTDHRRLPGDGEFDLDGFIDAVRDVGYDGPWGVEVLSKELRAEPYEEVYGRAYRAAAALFA